MLPLVYDFSLPGLKIVHECAELDKWGMPWEFLQAVVAHLIMRDEIHFDKVVVCPDAKDIFVAVVLSVYFRGEHHDVLFETVRNVDRCEFGLTRHSATSAHKPRITKLATYAMCFCIPNNFKSTSFRYL